MSHRLSKSQVNWREGENDNRWVVNTQAGEELAQFPSGWTERDVKAAMDLGRNFEREAYTDGVEAGQQSMEAATMQRVNELMSHIRQLEEHNSMLASKLEDLITNGMG